MVAIATDMMLSGDHRRSRHSVPAYGRDKSTTSASATSASLAQTGHSGRFSRFSSILTPTYVHHLLLCEDLRAARAGKIQGRSPTSSSWQRLAAQVVFTSWVVVDNTGVVTNRRKSTARQTLKAAADIGTRHDRDCRRAQPAGRSPDASTLPRPQIRTLLSSVARRSLTAEKAGDWRVCGLLPGDESSATTGCRRPRAGRTRMRASVGSTAETSKNRAAGRGEGL